MDLILKAASDSDKGKVYKHNEDTVFTKIRSPLDNESGGLLIVADGVGGHKAGEVASKIVVETIYDDFKSFLEVSKEPSGKRFKYDIETLENNLIQAIQDANIAIYHYAQENQSDAGNLGSTVTCALINNDQVIIANVGDSRTYHYRNGELTQITEDHSLVGEMVKKGIVAPKDIYTHPHRSVITRALGNEKEVEVDLFRISMQTGDKLFLCSDGLWEMIHSLTEIAEILAGEDNLEGIAKKLVATANEYGGKDNIGVAVATLVSA